MNQDPAEEALARELSARGYRAVTSQQWTRQINLTVVREQRRRYADHPRMQALEQYAGQLARTVAHHVQLPPQDIATVLLAAGATASFQAVTHDLPGPMVTEILQIAGDDLDRLADGGETP